MRDRRAITIHDDDNDDIDDIDDNNNHDISVADLGSSVHVDNDAPDHLSPGAHHDRADSDTIDDESATDDDATQHRSRRWVRRR